MHSADYAVEKMSVCLSVCPSIRPSVKGRYSVETAKHIIKLFHHRVATPFQFFIQNGMAIFLGEPPNGASNTVGMKKSRFSANISFYLINDTRYSHRYYRMQIGNRTQALEWYHFE